MKFKGKYKLEWYLEEDYRGEDSPGAKYICIETLTLEIGGKRVDINLDSDAQTEISEALDQALRDEANDI